MPGVATDSSLSVVIAAFNAERTVVSAIRSALAQRRPPLEVIVVDDGSTDATRAVLREVQDRRVRLLEQANAGPGAARNTGIAAARGKYVGFLDSDDLWLPTYVEHMVRALEGAPRAGFAYTDAYVFDGASGQVRREAAMRAPDPPPADRLAFLAALLQRNFVYTSATAPAEVLAEIGGYNPARAACEEYDLWLRICLAGYDAAWVPGRHALYRWHGGQATTNSVRMMRYLAETYQGLSMDQMPTDGHRRLLEARRVQSERELRIERGDAGLASRLRRLRHALGIVRRRLGLTYAWYEDPPPEISAAFGDLRQAGSDEL